MCIDEVGCAFRRPSFFFSACAPTIRRAKQGSTLASIPTRQTHWLIVILFRSLVHYPMLNLLISRPMSHQEIPAARVGNLRRLSLAQSVHPPNNKPLEPPTHSFHNPPEAEGLPMKP